jgi:hypothetical protein
VPHSLPPCPATIPAKHFSASKYFYKEILNTATEKAEDISFRKHHEICDRLLALLSLTAYGFAKDFLNLPARKAIFRHVARFHQSANVTFTSIEEIPLIASAYE